MPIDSGNLALKGLDDLFSTEENRQAEQREQVQQIPIDALHPFTNHPFKVLDDEAMTRTVESIAQYGVLAPLIARPRPDGDGYEIISGHRRQYAAKLAGLETLPVIVRQMSDDAAVILMVDFNKAVSIYGFAKEKRTTRNARSISVRSYSRLFQTLDRCRIVRQIQPD